MIAYFRKVADSWWLIGITLSLQVASQVGIWYAARALDKYPDGPNMPDLRYRGYTAKELNAWYNGLGEQGCAAYARVAALDLFPYMVAYVSCFGAMLVVLAKSHGLSEKIAYLAVLIYVTDFVETMIQRRGAVIYPEQLSPKSIALASAACQIKWVALSVAVVTVFILYFIIPDKRDEGLPTDTRKGK